MALNSIPKRWFEIIQGDAVDHKEKVNEEDEKQEATSNKEEKSPQRNSLNRSFGSETKKRLPTPIVVPKIKIKRSNSAMKPL